MELYNLYLLKNELLFGSADYDCEDQKDARVMLHLWNGSYISVKSSETELISVNVLRHEQLNKIRKRVNKYDSSFYSLITHISKTHDAPKIALSLGIDENTVKTILMIGGNNLQVSH